VEVLSWLQGHAPAVHTTTPHLQQAHTAGSLAHLLGPADFVAYVLHVVLGRALLLLPPPFALLCVPQDAFLCVCAYVAMTAYCGMWGSP
jgi:hypothetical protein